MLNNQSDWHKITPCMHCMHGAFCFIYIYHCGDISNGLVLLCKYNTPQMAFANILAYLFYKRKETDVHLQLHLQEIDINVNELSLVFAPVTQSFTPDFSHHASPYRQILGHTSRISAACSSTPPQMHFFGYHHRR